jgi:hypothetical protein
MEASGTVATRGRAYIRFVTVVFRKVKIKTTAAACEISRTAGISGFV